MKLLASEPVGIIPVLAQKAYLSCKSNSFGWIQKGDLCISFFIDIRYGFKRMVFSNSVFNLNGSSVTAGEEKRFLEELTKLAKKNEICDFIYKAQSNVVFQSEIENAENVPWGTYIVSLQEKNPESIIAGFHGKHRNVVKKAIKDGVIIKSNLDINTVYHCIKDTMVRQGSVFFPSLDYLSKLKNNLPENILFLGAYLNDVLQGVAVIVFDKSMGYYLYGGSISHPHTGSMNLLQYEIMKELLNRNVQYYDLVGARIKTKEGSKYHGLKVFKERFGAELKSGFAFRYICNPFKFYLFKFLISVYCLVFKKNFEDPIEQIQKEMVS